MSELAVVIPSKTLSNLIPCVESIRKNEPKAAITVVDDLCPFGPADSLDPNWAICRWCAQQDINWVRGDKPFIFARNCNIGIESVRMDGDPDVILHNDDALLETKFGFTTLQVLANRNADIGIIAPVTNITGQVLQWPKGIGLRSVPHIAFVSVLIPSRTLDQVGLLDEQYCLDYGVEDRDYCTAVTRSGLKVCVYDHVFVDHSKLVSSFRGDPKTPKSFMRNWGLYLAKWGPTIL